MLKFFGYLFTFGFIVFCGVAIAIGYIVWETSKSLPDYQKLAEYAPPVMTRIHAGDGSLLAEYAKERRLFVPINVIPKQLRNAFLSAEDKKFYSHGGLNFGAIARAASYDVKILFNRYVLKKRGGNLIGASTITQQVAKNFLLTSDQTFDRKLKEALLALRIEGAFSKDEILELYLNEIYLGFGAYGVAGASLSYFGKSLNELNLAEMAYLAALPKGPTNYHPYRHRKAAIERRNWVLKRMFQNEYITKTQYTAAIKRDLVITPRKSRAPLFAAESFAEEVRREVINIYGRDKLYNGGLSVRTTLDPKLQIYARQTLAAGLVRFDRHRGWRGAIKKLKIDGDWGKALSKLKIPKDLAPWRLAVVLKTNKGNAKIGLQPAKKAGGKLEKTREIGTIPLKLMTWARKVGKWKGKHYRAGPKVKKVSQVLKPGDVVYVAPANEDNTWHLVQMPEVQGALIAMDPHTGRVLAMVGGFSYGKSQFNRAIQAERQPGSAIKPFVYAAALDDGYTPASVVNDSPIEIKLKNGEVWKPKNYSDKFYGPSTLRIGIERSRNAMTVRLVNDMGIERLKAFTEKVGIYDNMRKMMAMSLGAGETTLMRMVKGYAVFDVGGKQVNATLIDRIQDRYGHTIYRHDTRDCIGCNAAEWANQPEPEIFDNRKQLINPYTAYQITSMLEGVVQRGTGKELLKLGKPVAGKTGTTNNERDAWFIGYTPDLVVGTYVGYDNPRPMGHDATGGHLAAPIVREFMQLALKGHPATPFRVPSGIELIPINPKTGKRGVFGRDNVILEAFKPGERPRANTPVIGQSSNSAAPATAAVAAPTTRTPKVKAPVVIEGGLTTGTGGLY